MVTFTTSWTTSYDIDLCDLSYSWDIFLKILEIFPLFLGEKGVGACI